MADDDDDEAARMGLGLFLFAHISLAADADAELAVLGLNRTHHRILYLIARGPGTTLGELVRLLRLTPQAVQGPMQRLLRGGFVEQRFPAGDRRKRELYVTEAGAALQRGIAARQYARLRRAYAAAGPQATDGFFRTMSALLEASDLAYLTADSVQSCATGRRMPAASASQAGTGEAGRHGGALPGLPRAGQPGSAGDRPAPARPRARRSSSR